MLQETFTEFENIKEKPEWNHFYFACNKRAKDVYILNP